MAGLRACTVYCGSSFGSQSCYKEAAAAMGRLLAEAGLELVYGGGKKGLMGTLADAALEAGGRVVGVIPEFMKEQERAHLGLTELHVVEDMRTRKLRMLERGDAFLALPGGLGTLEEIVEALEWAVSGRQAEPKPVGILNLDGMYDPLVQLIRRSVSDGLERATCMQHVVVASSPAELLDGLNKLASVGTTAPQGHDGAVPSFSLPKQSLSASPEPRQAPWTAILADDVAPCSECGEEYFVAAKRFGQLLAHDGATIGLGCAAMQGTIADALAAGALEAGGSVASVVEAMASDGDAVAASGAEAESSRDMEPPRQARKRRLFEGSDRVVALPGGIAVWEELLETFSGAQLDRHSLPMGILNTRGFYGPFLRQLESTVQCGFLQQECLSYLVAGDTPEELLERLRSYSPTRVVK